MPGIYDTRVVRASAAHSPFVRHASPARSPFGGAHRGEHSARGKTVELPVRARAQ